MDRRQRSSLVAGLILILLGACFFVVQLIPNLRFWISPAFSWPLFVIGAGVLVLILGLALGAPGMAVPAAIVTGIGLLLYWQNATGNWESWAYVWALIPGFAGAGVLFAGLLGENPRQSFRDGVNLIIISLIMFVIAAAFLGGPNLLGPYWPVLIILFGVWLLVRPLWRAQR